MMSFRPSLRWSNGRKQTAHGSGTIVGPVVLRGRPPLPIGSIGIGTEVRYHSGEGNLPADQGFAGTKIDLGGFNYPAVVSIRF
jgi:hypothetical protein